MFNRCGNKATITAANSTTTSTSNTTKTNTSTTKTTTITTTPKATEEKITYEMVRDYQIKVQSGLISLSKVPEKIRSILLSSGSLLTTDIIDPMRFNRIMGYETGGYTGSWGEEGKIAILHDKELVLNRTDTSNILQAV